MNIYRTVASKNDYDIMLALKKAPNTRLRCPTTFDSR